MGEWGGVGAACFRENTKAAREQPSLARSSSFGVALGLFVVQHPGLMQLLPQASKLPTVLHGPQDDLFWGKYPTDSISRRMLRE